MLVLFLRNTEDWPEITWRQIVNRRRDKHSNVDRKTLRRAARHARVWDSVYRIDYFRYRQALHNIASDTWSNIPVVYENVQNLLRWVDDEDLIIPTDDDDWITDSLADYLVDADFVYWESAVLQCIPVASIHRWSNYQKGLCSNNYAVKAKALSSMPLEDASSMLLQHWQAEKLAQKHDLKMAMIPKPLSCYLRHVGSLHVLVNSPKMLFYPCCPASVPDWATWIEEPLCELQQLYRDLPLRWL